MSVVWSAAELDLAIVQLARVSGLPVWSDAAARVAAPAAESEERAVIGIAHRAGLDVEPLAGNRDEIANLLRVASPVVCRVDRPKGPSFLAIASAGGRTARLVTPGGPRKMPLDEVIAWILPPPPPEHAAECARIADMHGGMASKRRRIREALVAARTGACSVDGIYRLRLPVDVGLGVQLRRAGAIRRLAAFGVSYAAYYLLWILSFALLAQWIAVPDGASGWFVAWLLALASASALKLLSFRTVSELTIDVGGVLRERALAGMLRRSPRETQRVGIGSSLGQVLDLGSAETDGLRGLFNIALGGLELLLIGLGLLTLGSGLHAALLAGWVALVLVLARGYATARRRWNDRRLALSHDLIEDIVGHASCLVQRDITARLDADDRRLGAYLDAARDLDRRATLIANFAPRAWMLVAVLGLLPFLVHGGEMTALAVTLGGAVLAYRAFMPFAEGIAITVDASIVWRALAPILRVPSSAIDHARRGGHAEGSIMGAGLVARAGDRVVLDRVDVEVSARDRVWLHGASGTGKSTLARILAGLESPDAGAVLSGIDDPTSCGLDEWRRRVAYTPQFSSNHVFQGSLAFNLLLGRSWPPSPADLDDAHHVCAALGLAPLIARMPAGIHTVVGEIGWQLSHGERARVFLARSLLQRANAVVLDESLAALDPDTLRRTVALLERRNEAVVVIAHP